jgi:hypothetical protein
MFSFVSQLGIDPPSIPDIDIRFADHDHLPDDFPALSRGTWVPDADFDPSGENGMLRPTNDAPLIGYSLSDSSELVFSTDARMIWVSWNPEIDFQHIAAHIPNTVLGFNLRLRGLVCLHASGTVIDGQAVLFVGDSGRGKSTTAGFFARNGCPMLSDDFVALRRDGDQVMIDPGVPSARVFKDSGRALVEVEESEALTPIAPQRYKHYLSLSKSGYPFAESAVPLGAVYLLTPRGAATQIEPVSPLQALVTLTHHFYPWRTVDSRRWKDEFQSLASLVEHIPVRKLILPNQFERLSEVIEGITADVRSLQPIETKA